MDRSPHFISVILLALLANRAVLASMDLVRSQDLDMALALPSLNYWNDYMDPTNLSLGMGAAMGCSYCGEIFYHEPPPDDIIFIPSPPMYPAVQSSIASEIIKSSKLQNGDQCNFCNLFFDETEQSANFENINRTMSNGFFIMLGSITAIIVVVFLYLFSARKTTIIPSLTRTTIFKTEHNHQSNQRRRVNKNNPLEETLPRPGVNLSDPCYLQTNREKNLNSPIISDQVSHKKTAIPSKCWAQPGSMVNRTIRRIPNEYEVPSSQTNSTGASSAFYGDMNHDHRNQGNNGARFFSPYNLHTYAEVREVLDPMEHFHTSSNSSAMLSESNYDNALYPHQGNMTLQTVPNGSVQMSDFNSMRAPQTMSYQPSQMTHHHHQQNMNHPNEANLSHAQPIYEQPQHRAQVIITSNNQGVNPAILSHHDRNHNVI